MGTDATAHRASSGGSSLLNPVGFGFCGGQGADRQRDDTAMVELCPRCPGSPTTARALPICGFQRPPHDRSVVLFGRPLTPESGRIQFLRRTLFGTNGVAFPLQSQGQRPQNVISELSTRPATSLPTLHRFGYPHGARFASGWRPPLAGWDSYPQGPHDRFPRLRCHL